MNLLLDTNVLIHLIKKSNPQLLTNIINPERQKIFVSIVSIGELQSIALQNNWSVRKLEAVNAILEKVSIVEINEILANTYAEIDAFSQRRNPSYSDYSFSTPRNMGKNDLWIAATATLLGLKLVTADADFNHLHNIFTEIHYLTAESLK